MEALSSDLPDLLDDYNYNLMQSVLAEGTDKQVLTAYIVILSCHHHLTIIF